MLKIQNVIGAAEDKLQQLAARVLQATPPETASNTRSCRRSRNMQVVPRELTSGRWRARVASTMAVIQACNELLHADTNTRPIALQQVVHFTRRCSGADCAPKDAPIYGVRYECLQCAHDFCSACYEGHDPTHVLQFHRTVLPSHAATPSSLWEVLRIDKHEDGHSGRTYRVVWAGNWAPEFVTRESLNNDDLVDRYTHAHTHTHTHTHRHTFTHAHTCTRTCMHINTH
jgi:hypothetical protein